MKRKTITYGTTIVQKDNKQEYKKVKENASNGRTVYFEIAGEKFSINIAQREHLEMAYEVEKGILYTSEDIVNEDRVRKILKKMKNRKAPGSDGLKTELFKCLEKSNQLVEEIVTSLKGTLEAGIVPEGWKNSLTKMIPKVRKPKVHELRPIALTNQGYKLMMGVIRLHIEEHIKKNELEKEVQGGFTEGARMENNLVILRYCIEKSYKMKKPLIVIAIDFQKAYDSVKREEIINILMKNKINPQIINLLVQLYNEDKTTIVTGEEKLDMEVWNGIRQGCTASTTIFKLITFEIIKRLEHLHKGFQDEFIKISSIFYADDGMLLASSKEVFFLSEGGRLNPGI